MPFGREMNALGRRYTKAWRHIGGQRAFVQNAIERVDLAPGHFIGKAPTHVASRVALCPLNIRFREIVPFEQKGQSIFLCQRINKAITHV
jgi:hypothetical protein